MDVTAEAAICSRLTDQSGPPRWADGPPNTEGNGADLRRRILASIELHTRSVAPPQAWAVLGATRSMRQLRGDPGDLVSALQREYSNELLLTARVLEPSSDNALRLSPIFGDSAASFVLRRDKDKTPIDAVSARGVLSTAEPEWLGFAAERADGDGDHGQPLLLAFDDAESLLFHRLGLKFTSAAGLARISGARVSTLFAAPPQPAQRRKFTLTLAGWQVAECVNKPSQRTLTTIAHLCAIRKRYGFDPGSVFGVWLPSNDEFADIRSALAFADRNLIAKTMLACLSSSCFAPHDAQIVIRDRTEISYGAARQNLARTISGSHCVPLAGEAAVDLTKLQEAFRKAVVEKLLTPDAKGDPWDRWRSLMAADLAEAWFNKLDIVRAARTILTGEHPGARTFDECLFGDRLRIIDGFTKLYRLRPARNGGRES